MVLSNNELYDIYGGGSNKAWGLGILFAAIGTMIVGILDGFMRPLSCNV